MSDYGADSTAKVVIRPDEIAHFPERPPQNPARISTSARIGSAILALCLPALCVLALILRITLRQSGERRALWNSWLCVLFIFSGLFSAAGWAVTGYVISHNQSQPPISPEFADLLGLVSHDQTTAFPALPASRSLNATEIANMVPLLVFIVLQPDRFLPTHASVGAAVLIMADENGYLLATNKHVVAPESGSFLFSGARKVQVISKAGSYAQADIVGTHADLDLALLWIPRRSGKCRFRHPIAAYSDIQPGQSIFVVGHPHGLYFTLSNGLISRVDGSAMLQTSAPVSPGNSGGPVWDAQGNLLGIVTSTFDKRLSPNAENLNFSTRADALRSEIGWKFRDNGAQLLKSFINPQPAELN